LDGVWSCESCRVIHRTDVAEKVLDGLMKGESVPQVWKTLEEFL